MNPTSIIDLSHPLVEPVPCYPGDPQFKMCLSCSFPLPPKSTSVTKTTTESRELATDSDLQSNDAIGGTEPSMVVTVHAVSLGTHTGTHVDAPFHFFPSGQKLHEIEISRFVGRAVVLDVRHLARERGRIAWEDIVNATTEAGVKRTSTLPVQLSRIGLRTEGKADIVLLWTGWDVHWGSPKYFAHPYFSRDVAIALHNLGAKIVGVDVLNPDETPASENAETKDGWGMHEELLGNGVLICENLKGIEGLIETDASMDEEVWVSLMPLSIHADGSPVRAYGWRQAVAGQAL